jgi:ADP-dependent phosphofructokinase/glucokinase
MKDKQDILKEAGEIENRIKYILELFTGVATNITNTNNDLTQQHMDELFNNLKKDAFNRLAIAFPKEIEEYIKNPTDLVSSYLSPKFLVLPGNKNDDDE